MQADRACSVARIVGQSRDEFAGHFVLGKISLGRSKLSLKGVRVARHGLDEFHQLRTDGLDQDDSQHDDRNQHDPERNPDRSAKGQTFAHPVDEGSQACGKQHRREEQKERRESPREDGPYEERSNEDNRGGHPPTQSVHITLVSFSAASTIERPIQRPDMMHQGE